MSAQSANEVHTAFLEAFNSGSVDALLGLYEDNAAFTSQEVARRGADGIWRYVIDDPGFGR